MADGDIGSRYPSDSDLGAKNIVDFVQWVKTQLDAIDLSSVDARIATAVKQCKDDILDGVGEDYDTLKELAAAIGDNKDLIKALTEAATSHISYTSSQSLSDTQKATARENIGASASSALDSYLTKSDASTTYLGINDKAVSAGTADSATKATQDESGNTITSTYLTQANASSTYLPIANPTATGTLTTPVAIASTYFRTPHMVGEGDLSTYYHRLDFGYSGHNLWDFYEYGGVFNFYKNTTANGSGKVLLGAINSNGWTGNVKGNVTGNVTGNCSGSSGSCTGNAATATKATADADGNTISSTYLKAASVTAAAGSNIGSVGTPSVSYSSGTFTFDYLKGETGEQGIQGIQGVQGDTGPRGYYFTPAVSSAGVLSWTNNGGLTNPSDVSVIGPQGDTGDTGPRGYTFTPSVSSDGVLSWTNDGGLTNPDSIQLAVEDYGEWSAS